jgi:membrane peptidoglycan carboxypeptidase
MYNSRMSSLPHLTARRRKRREEQSLPFAVRGAGAALILTGTILAVILTVSAGLGYSNLSGNLPSLDALPLLFDPLNGQLLQPTRIYDRTGEHLLFTLENPTITERVYLPLAAIPEELINAVVAAIEPDYWENQGFSFSSSANEKERPIAQQLAATFLLTMRSGQDESIWRERLLGAQMIAEFGREQALEWYLNSADFGHLAYGVEAAAQVYFGKAAKDLTLAEAAMLAAIAQAPDLNPFDAQQLALDRQRMVLEAMVRQGYLSEEEAVAANLTPLALETLQETPEPEYADFIRLVLDQMTNAFGNDRIARGGLRIQTTLDIELQVQVACATLAHLARLNQTVEEEASQENCEAGRLLPNLAQEHIPAGQTIEASVIVLEPATGQISALVGDAQQGHTPGTLLTPFVYLTGFTRGLGPASLVWDIPAGIPAELSQFTNDVGPFDGPMRIRMALANDHIAPALQTLTQLGPENVWRIAQQSGLNSLQTPFDQGRPFGETAYRLLLDEGRVNLLEAAQAFGLFGNQGALAGQPVELAEGDDGFVLQPTAVLKVSDYSGRVLVDWEQPQIRTIISAQLAYLMTDVLSDELAREASQGRNNPLTLGRPSAAKTGQTISGEEVWTLGYTPQLLVGVWAGSEARETEGALSPMLAANLWHAVAQFASRDRPVLSWDVPIGVSRIDVCDPSGLLPTVDCPTIVNEVFVTGNEPTQLDNLYRSFLINRQTGRLATVFTPAELIDERVFLVMPPEAQTWAQEAGIARPPETYDVLFIPPTSENVRIASPEMFSYAGGELHISGSAGGENFDFYRIQVGEGLNPREWLQIGGDVRDPVEQGELAVWDTQGLGGLYAVRLTVVRQDQSVETATIQLTVDNEAPEIQILFPAEGQGFSFPAERTLTFQVQANDNLGIGAVEFYLNGELVGSVAQSPFAVTWNGQRGEHILRVAAIDLAGNEMETSIAFAIE